MAKKRGFIFDLMDQLENNSNIHRVLIEQLENKLQRNIVVYHANLGHPVSLMLDHDAEVLENVLSTLDREKYGQRLDLFIHTPGGLPEAAAKIVQVCRSYSSGFRVVVPSTAMSAGTLLAMGADEILMSDTSKLGPIDPQMPQADRTGRQFLRPAKSYIDAFTALIAECHREVAARRPAQAFLHLLNNQDPSWIIECQRARKATEKLAFDFLKGRMLTGKTDEEIGTTVAGFVTAGDEGTHGSPIFYERARQIGLKIEYVDKESEVWKIVREVFVRLENYVGSKGIAKYVLCRNGGIDLRVEVRQ